MFRTDCFLLAVLLLLANGCSAAIALNPAAELTEKELKRVLTPRSHASKSEHSSLRAPGLKEIIHSTAETAEDTQKIYECFQTLLGAAPAVVSPEPESDTRSGASAGAQSTAQANLRGIPSTAVMGLTFEAQGDRRLANETYLRASHLLTDPGLRIPANLLPIFEATSKLLQEYSKSSFGFGLRAQLQEIIGVSRGSPVPSTRPVRLQDLPIKLTR